MIFYITSGPELSRPCALRYLLYSGTFYYLIHAHSNQLTVFFYFFRMFLASKGPMLSEFIFINGKPAQIVAYQTLRS